MDSPRVSRIFGVFIEQRGSPGGTRGGHNPPGRVWASWRALVGCAPLGAPPGASLAHLMSSGPKKSRRSLAVFGLHLVLISCDVKNMQKLIDMLEDSDDVQNVWHNLENEEDLDR